MQEMKASDNYLGAADTIRAEEISLGECPK